MADPTQIKALEARIRRLEDDLAVERRSTAALRERMRALTVDEGHELLTNLARLVPGVIYQYRLDPDGGSCFPYSSPGMEEIYEVTPEEVREDATPVFGRLHPDDLERVSADIFASAEALSTFFCEFRVVLPRQGLRWRWCQAHPERLPDGGTLWHGIITDITERKAAEAEKEELQKQLLQAHKMESVGRLAGGVAHDYNNMLSVILGYSELALDSADRGESVRAEIEEIQRAARRSTAITRQLLAFSRQQTVAPRTLDLNETVDSIHRMLRRLIDERIELAWRPGAQVWPVRIDPVQVDQILVNLCVNARDAIEGAGRIEITTANTSCDAACADQEDAAPGDYVVLAVADDGAGIAASVREHLFEPFFTTKKVGEGTGMGLATVYGIVRQNEGFITVDSELGAGTTIRVHLPRRRRESAPAPVPAGATPRARHGETVLVVEDEPDILRLTSTLLERLGYRVMAAESPAAAIAFARDRGADIDLLVTDVIMPAMNGRELAGHIRAVAPGVAVLYVSGYPADVIAHRGVLDDGVHFLQKPFSRQDLALAVRAAREGEKRNSAAAE